MNASSIPSAWAGGACRGTYGEGRGFSLGYIPSPAILNFTLMPLVPSHLRSFPADL